MSPTALLDRAPAAAAGKVELRGEISAQQPRWLTDAVASTLHAERGTVKQVAAALGVPDRQVYDVADLHNPKPLKAAWLPTICTVTGSFTLLDVLERRVGRVAFAVVAADGHDDVMQQALAREVTAFGEFLSETAADVADNAIDAGELQRILPAIDRILARTCEFRSMVIEKAKLDAAAAVRR